MRESPDRIAELLAVASEDGETVVLQAKTRKGETLESSCNHLDFQKLINEFIEVGDHCANKRTGHRSKPISSEKFIDLAPIPITDIRFIIGSKPDQMVVILRLVAFDLAFAMPSKFRTAIERQLAKIPVADVEQKPSVH